MEAAIKTLNLKKTYKSKGKSKKKKVEALKGLDLEIKKGDIYGFVGPNGAGKTTSIKIIVGLINATEGTASIFGKQAGSVDAKFEMGYLSEVANYYPFMEVGKLLDFYCSFYEIPGQERKMRIDEVLALVGLADKKDARMRELSKGMQQRFGIAQAIIADPPLLVLDELTSGLDPIAQKEVKDIILELKKRDKTIFFSSHQMTEVEHICDQIGIIDEGVLLQSAPLETFLKEGSGQNSFIVFSLDEQNIYKDLKDKGLKLEEVRLNTYKLIVPDTDVNEMIDTLRANKADIIQISPYIYSLEDVFFKLIKGGKSN
jgi:ABC-2 type transport system ATP-binding protein